MIFRRLILSALLVGFLAGMLATAVQLWHVVPIIQSAELFEAPPAAVPVHGQAGHQHSEDEWAPADGVQRSSFTLISNVLTAIGFALVLLAAMVASLNRGAAAKLDWRHGLLWAGAGYAVFFAAPALGLPPEIPGAAAAPLQSRQLWWVMTVVLTASGLGIAAFGKSPWRWAGLLLLVVPHLIGAPHPQTAMFADQPPAAAAELTRLARQFISATAIANAALWLTLGLASVWTVQRFVKPMD